MGIRITIIREDRLAEAPGRRLTRRTALASLVAAATLAAAGGVAIAASPAGPGVLRGCYSTRTGALRLLTAAGSSCRAGEKAVSWNQSGFRWTGSWRSGASYRAGDAVSYQGSSYIAIADSSGKVPSLSPRFWSVLAAAGQPGRPGQGALASAEFYEVQTGFLSVSSGQPVPFNHQGATSGAAISQVSPTSFQLAEPGTYDVAFQIPTEDDGELELALNGTPLPATAVGREGPFGGQIVGDELIQTTAPDQTLSLVNRTSFDLFIDFFSPGPDPFTASLVIKLLSRS